MNKNYNIKKLAYVILSIAIMMCLGTVYSWSIFRIPVETMFDIGSAKSGLPYMISLLFYSLGVFVTGKCLNRYSPRNIICLGGLFVGAGWILSGYAQDIFTLTATYGIIIGSGVGIAYGVPITLMTKWYPDKKGFVVGIVLIGFGLSPVITAPIAEILIEAYGVPDTFKFLGIIFLLILPILSLPLKYPGLNEQQNLGVPCVTGSNNNNLTGSEMIKNRNFKGLYICFIIGTTVGLMIIGITGNVGVEIMKLSPKTVAFYMSSFALFNGLGRPVFGWLSDKIPHKKVMVVSYVLIILAAVLMIWAKEGNTVFYSIAFSIFWFNVGGWLAIAPSATLTFFGTDNYSRNYGIVFTAYGIGAVTGVFISGLLKDVFHNYNSVFYFIIAISIPGVIISQKLIKQNLYDTKKADIKDIVK